MVVLIGVAFIAGLVTAVSPCVLPILPIVLATGAGDDKRRPYFVIAGLIASFSFFTLTSVQIIDALHLPSATLRDIAIVIVALFGLTLIVPALSTRFERLTAGLPAIGDRLARSNRWGVFGGFVTGIGLGLVWTPCAGPILGAVTSLAVTAPGSPTTLAMVIAYALGAGLPLLAIALGGRAALARLRLRSAGRWAGRALGILVLATAGLMAIGADTWISNELTSSLPDWTGTLQTLERTTAVQDQLNQLENHTATNIPGNGSPGSSLVVGPAAPDFAQGDVWLNSAPLNMADLRGKVVLVDFWTYSCINCIRTLPYVESWYKKYAADGFVVVGVHTPEFEFEHDTSNVQAAITRFGITYPVVQDNNYDIWTSYSNEYWPADYLIDANGNIRATHFGEGDYVQSELDIRSLLAEAGAAALPGPAKTEAPVPISNDQTGETYIGTDRGTAMTSPEAVQPNVSAKYTFPSTLPAGGIAASGSFNFQPEYTVAEAAGDKLELSFTAGDVYLVMYSPKPVPATVTVTGIDGVTGATVTEDVAADGSMTIGPARLYHLVHLPAMASGAVTITFNAPGAQAYAFTFGS
jgi:cytochrome c biogenesis protein CcdA/thiol-disulfide isomerase/thioredoxin